MQEKTEIEANDRVSCDGFLFSPGLVMDKKNRRSSILKKVRNPQDPDTTSIEDREESETKTLSRKVRFSSNFVKPFTTEDNITVWDATYEEAIGQSSNSLGSSAGSKSALKVSQSCIGRNTCNIYVDPEQENVNKPNFDTTRLGEDINVCDESDGEGAVANKTILFDNTRSGNMEFTATLSAVDKENLYFTTTNQSRKTIFFNPNGNEADMEITKSIELQNSGNTRKTILFSYNDDEANMDVTNQNMPTLLAGKFADDSRKTVFFNPNDNGADMDLTKHLGATKPANTRKTILFNGNEANMDLTNQITPTTGNLHVGDVTGNSRQTVFYNSDDNRADMDLTKHLGATKPANTRKTIIFNDNEANMDLTNQITPTTGNLHVGDITANSRKTVFYNSDDNRADMDLTKHLGATKPANTRKTIIFNDNEANMDLTNQITPTTGNLHVGDITGSSRKTVFYNSDDNGAYMDLTKQSKPANTRKTIIFNDNEANMDLTNQITSTTGNLLVGEVEANSRKTVFFNPDDNEADMDLTKPTIQHLANGEVPAESPKTILFVPGDNEADMQYTCMLGQDSQKINRNNTVMDICAHQNASEQDAGMEFTCMVKQDLAQNFMKQNLARNLLVENHNLEKINKMVDALDTCDVVSDKDTSMEFTCMLKPDEAIACNPVDNKEITATKTQDLQTIPSHKNNSRIADVEVDVEVSPKQNSLGIAVEEVERDDKHRFHASNPTNISGCEFLDYSGSDAARENMQRSQHDETHLSEFMKSNLERNRAGLSGNSIYLLDESNRFFDSNATPREKLPFCTPTTSCGDTRKLLNFNSCGKEATRSDFTRLLDGELEDNFELGTDFMPLKSNSTSFEIFPKSTHDTLNNDGIELYNESLQQSNDHSENQQHAIHSDNQQHVINDNQQLVINTDNQQPASSPKQSEINTNIDLSEDMKLFMERYHQLPDRPPVTEETIDLIDLDSIPEEETEPDFKAMSLDELLKHAGLSHYMTFDYKEPLFEATSELEDLLKSYTKTCKRVVKSVDRFLNHKFVGSHDGSVETSEDSCEQVLEVPESLEELIEKTASKCNKDVCSLLRITPSEDDHSTESSYKIQTFFATITITIKIDGDKGVIKMLQVESEVPINADPIFKMLQKLFLEKLSAEKIHSSVGSTYTIFTLIDYLQFQMVESQKLTREFRHLATKYAITMDDEFNFHYPIANKRLCLHCEVIINGSSYPSFPEDCIEVKVQRGQIDDEEIKRLANDCMKDFSFIRHFALSVKEYLQGVKQ